MKTKDLTAVQLMIPIKKNNQTTLAVYMFDTETFPGPF